MTNNSLTNEELLLLAEHGQGIMEKILAVLVLADRRGRLEEVKGKLRGAKP